MPIDITIHLSASTGDELDMLINALHSQLGSSVKTVQHTGDLTAAAVVSDAPKRTRAKKEDAPATDPAPEQEETKAQAPALPEKEVAEQPTQTLSVVGDLSPKEARDQAIKILQQHFGANPNNMEIIQRLQTKYGVKMFSDVKDEQAHDFLSDAKLVQSGSFNVAA